MLPREGHEGPPLLGDTPVLDGADPLGLRSPTRSVPRRPEKVCAILRKAADLQNRSALPCSTFHITASFLSPLGPSCRLLNSLLYLLYLSLRPLDPLLAFLHSLLRLLSRLCRTRRVWRCTQH